MRIQTSMSLEDFAKKYQAICNQRGYLVLAWHPQAQQPRIGQEIKTFHVPDMRGFTQECPFTQPFSVGGRTTVEDFEEQAELLKPRGASAADLDCSNFLFYRAYTD
jgi:hypothetical protein